VTIYTHSPDPSTQYAILRKIRGSRDQTIPGYFAPQEKIPWERGWLNSCSSWWFPNFSASWFTVAPLYECEIALLRDALPILHASIFLSMESPITKTVFSWLDFLTLFGALPAVVFDFELVLLEESELIKGLLSDHSFFLRLCW
jgi:hypothetical protein